MANSKSIHEIREIVGMVRYKNWSIDVHYDEDYETGAVMRPWLQVSFKAPDIDTGANEIQKGRKWWLSPWMTETELVTTAFKAIMAAEEHEVRENFTFKGRRIYDPHFSVDDLVHLSDHVKRDSRGKQ